MSFFCDIEGCDYKSDNNSHMKRHKANKHDIDIIWHLCKELNCKYKCKNASDLKKHMQSIHSINIEWKHCDISNCNFKTKQSSNLIKHKATIHGINIKWFNCDVEQCSFKSKSKYDITRHKRDIHDIDVTWYSCDIIDCNFKSKNESNVKKHKSNIHGIDTQIFKCDVDLCIYQSKTSGGLKRHKSNIHEIDVKWYNCDIKLCQFKSKTNSDLKQHKAAIHNINTRWFKCDVPYCNHEAKRNADLNKHKRVVHDIGDLDCESCFKKCVKLINCTFENSTLKCCKSCYFKITGHKNSSEKIVYEWLKKNYEYPIIRANQSVNGEVCLSYRPDIMYASENLVIYVEVDEYQHKTNSDYSCDERRMSDLYDETPGKLVVFIRFNPDDYFLPDKNKSTVSLQERLQILLLTLNYITENHTSLIDQNYIHCFYLFYSPNNTFISKNLPVRMVHSYDDLTHNKNDNVKII